MSTGARAHPPKKKHPPQPRRPPTEPLSDEARRNRASHEFGLAQVHLAEAEKLAVWGEAPNACIHSAYYAMHHCAVAVLLAAGGVGKSKDVPRSHEHVIEHFGNLVAGEPQDLAELGVLLSRARRDRMAADYGTAVIPGADRAAAITSEARRFFDACAARWMAAPGRQR